MKFSISILLLLLSSFKLFSQISETQLSQLKSKKDAEKYLEANPKADGKIFHIAFRSDAAEIFSQLLNQKPGFSFKIDNYTYKLLEFDSVLCNRVSYIYLDGSKMNKSEIEKLRQMIIAKYKSGVSFSELASQYSMDGNSTGDTGWFTDNAMVPEFENAVKKHKKGDIFMVDTPSLNWYHVVLKTHAPSYQVNFLLLKIKCSS